MEEEESILPSEGVKLTPKQLLFIREYCKDFNASRAARAAGYSEKASKEIGYENITKPHIKAAIKEYFDSKAMEAEEVISRLTDWGRGSIENFITFEESEVSQEEEVENKTITSFSLDLTSEKARQNLHLIKKIKQGQYGLEIELHDAKDAVVQLGKIRGLFVEKFEGSVKVKSAKDLSDDDLARIATGG